MKKQNGQSAAGRRVSLGKAGFMLAETVVAAAILATMVAAYMTFYASIKRNFRTTDYDYVAVNLCRDVLAFAGGHTYLSNSTIICDASSGYASADCTNMFPGVNLKTQGLVPRGAPDSVVVTLTTAPFPGYTDHGNINVTAKLEWKDSTDGPTKSYQLSTIPMTFVNDQFRLTESSFDWT